MIEIPGYQIHQVILEEPSIIVCYATSEALSRAVLVKIAKEGPRMILENAKLMNEYEMTSNLRMDGVLQPHALLRQGNSLILVSEWLEGLTLRHFAQSAEMSIPLFLQLAIRITGVLEQLHHRNILHMNVRPDTIVVVPSSLRICFTGMGHSIYDIPGQPQARNMPLFESGPAYMAPERTGPLNRPVEGSSDLYSLGITFYEVLAKRLPFTAADPLAWGHAHIALSPVPLSTYVPSVPGMIEAIISRLLEKTVERRYLSASGLKADLEHCLQLWEQHGQIEPFELGRLDMRKSSLLDLQPSEDYRLLKVEESAIDAKVDQAGYARMLELAAIVRASEAFAGEKNGFHLAEQLMKIMLEAAGAQKGFYISAQADALFVVQPQAASPLNLMPLSEFAEACSSFIRETAARQVPIIIEDAALHGAFVDDPYVIRYKPKSVLGLPIFAQGALSGVIYLENNLVAGVFTPDRLSVLHVLATQMQIIYQSLMMAGSDKIKLLGREADHGLTAREIEVLQEMAAGLSNKEIAVQLKLSSETVKVHVRNIYDKLDVNNRVRAVALAAQLNLLDL
ncbi:LuxR C-terminal-related transcriptional regulator [Paenibacillus aestuarii]|uniref:LuxR C-terminal-related transcriptional regulator n=1 Tax=Paenibacillus aestuarii TaxID=516965 RepID=A0ABW0K5T1_9BACL|nr:LuxR C-terminal-related transcriptional regulator [Paenibacillus aestuarii]